jgi:hypothetical protein
MPFASGVSAPPALSDASLYPRSYRVAPSSRIPYVVLGGLSALAGLAGVVYFATGHQAASSPGAAVFLSVLSFSFVLLGSSVCASVLRTKVTLSPDSIEVESLFSSRKLSRTDIAGRRILRAQYMNILELTPRNQSEKKLKISLILKTDTAFDRWFSTLPDLNAEDIARQKQDLASEIGTGPTDESINDRLAQGRTIAKWLNWIAIASVFWGLYYPAPYRLVVFVLAALPIVVLLLLAQSKGLYDLQGLRNDARPSLALPFILPGLGLLARSVFDFDLLNWEQLLIAAAFIALTLTLVAATLSRVRGRSYTGFLVAFALLIAYAWGALAEANVLFDKTVPHTFEVRVLAKHVSQGRSTTWYLSVGPWGPRSAPQNISVPYRLYASSPVGSTVCIELRDGALKLPWYYASACHQPASLAS